MNAAHGIQSSAWLLVAAGTVSLALVSCRTAPSGRPDTSSRSASAGGVPQQTTSAQEEPDTTPPADVSHGEAKIGGPEAEPAPVSAQLAPAEPRRLHRIRLEMKHAAITVAPGVRYSAWTFGGTVPGPVLRVRQGDTVDFTLINRANIPHSMDFHAAEIAPSKYYVNVLPGDSLHYRFVAHVPGAFMYHCGTAPAAMHIANGMYGAIIVDPARSRPRAREFVFVQSEFYLTSKPAADYRSPTSTTRRPGSTGSAVPATARACTAATRPRPIRSGRPTPTCSSGSST